MALEVWQVCDRIFGNMASLWQDFDCVMAVWQECGSVAEWKFCGRNVAGMLRLIFVCGRCVAEIFQCDSCVAGVVQCESCVVGVSHCGSCSVVVWK